MTHTRAFVLYGGRCRSHTPRKLMWTAPLGALGRGTGFSEVILKNRILRISVSRSTYLFYFDVFIVSWFCVTLLDEQCMKLTCSLTSTIGPRTRFLRGAVGRKPNFSEVSAQVLRSTPQSSQKYRAKFSEVSNQVLRT